MLEFFTKHSDWKQNIRKKRGFKRNYRERLDKIDFKSDKTRALENPFLKFPALGGFSARAFQTYEIL